MTERPADMLDLPTELRCMIDENIPFKGKIVVYAKYELEQAIEPATSALLQVHPTIRSEFERYFYRNQTFEFTSIASMKTFLQRIGPYNASQIRYIILGDLFCRSGINQLTNLGSEIDEYFPALQTLSVTALAYDWVNRYRDCTHTPWGHQPRRLGNKLSLLLLSCKTFQTPNLQVYLYGEPRHVSDEVRLVFDVSGVIKEEIVNGWSEEAKLAKTIELRQSERFQGLDKEHQKCKLESWLSRNRADLARLHQLTMPSVEEMRERLAGVVTLPGEGNAVVLNSSEEFRCTQALRR